MSCERSRKNGTANTSHRSRASTHDQAQLGAGARPSPPAGRGIGRPIQTHQRAGHGCGWRPAAARCTWTTCTGVSARRVRSRRWRPTTRFRLSARRGIMQRQIVEVVAVQRPSRHIGQGRGVGDVRFARQERALAEDIAGADGRQHARGTGDLHPAFIYAGRASHPRCRAGRSPGPRRIAHGAQPVRHLTQLVGVQTGHQFHAAQMTLQRLVFAQAQGAFQGARNVGLFREDRLQVGCARAPRAPRRWPPRPRWCSCGPESTSASPSRLPALTFASTAS